MSEIEESDIKKEGKNKEERKRERDSQTDSIMRPTHIMNE